MDPLLPVLVVLALVWGSIWGSFLNVVVYRVPAGLSVVRPASCCPRCSETLRWWQNIPVLGWALLGGRCWFCKEPISWRYPAVEATSAALVLAASMPWIGLGLSGELAWQVAVSGALLDQTLVLTLIGIALIDADTFMIPDALSLPLIIVGMVAAVAVGDARGVSWMAAGAGALAAGAGLLLVQLGYAALSGREGLGTGDIKLLAAIAAWTGLASVPAVLLLAAVQGLLFSLGLAATSRGVLAEERGLASLRHLAVPFGPFLALAAVEWLLLHRQLAGPLEHLFGL